MELLSVSGLDHDLSEKKDGKMYYFAMNGQTGKICGMLPVDGKKLAVLFMSVFLPVFLLLLIGGYLI